MHDPSGAVVQGTTVSIEPAAGGVARTLTTDATGSATAKGLASGEYTVTADKTGFERSERRATLADNSVE